MSGRRSAINVISLRVDRIGRLTVAVSSPRRDESRRCERDELRHAIEVSTPRARLEHRRDLLAFPWSARLRVLGDSRGYDEPGERRIGAGDEEARRQLHDGRSVRHRPVQSIDEDLRRMFPQRTRVRSELRVLCGGPARWRVRVLRHGLQLWRHVRRARAQARPSLRWRGRGGVRRRLVQWEGLHQELSDDGACTDPTKPHCSSRSHAHTCESFCDVDSHCAGASEGRKCMTYKLPPYARTKSGCGCESASDCKSGSLCDHETSTCVSGDCEVDSECKSSPNGTYCIDRHCSKCSSNADCVGRADGPGCSAGGMCFCNGSTHLCPGNKQCLPPYKFAGFGHCW